MYPNSDKKIVLTIEARMASTRLPGKVLLPLAGKPALERLIERLKPSAYVDEIVVATTVNSADTAIVSLASRVGVTCFRGSEIDVLGRVLGAARSVQGDIIVEITGDCPLVDAKLVDRAIEEFFSKEVDYAANCLHQSFPLGFEVQVFPTSVLAEVDRLTQDPVDRTHVSYYIYTHPEKFRLHSWEAAEGERGSEMRVTLDEPEDYEVLNRIFEELLPSGQTFGARDVVALLKSRPDIQSLNENIRQKEASEG